MSLYCHVPRAVRPELRLCLSSSLAVQKPCCSTYTGPAICTKPCLRPLVLVMTPNRQVDELNAYFPVASSSRIDSATVLSQPARTPAGTPPVTMSWVGQSAAATGEMGEVEKRRETPGAVGVGTEHAGLDELPPESVLRLGTRKRAHMYTAGTRPCARRRR
jgi:hypothetical protein